MNLSAIQNLEADDKGTILVELNGVPRRFVKEKFISYLQRNLNAPGFQVPKVKIQKVRKIRKPKKEKKLKVKKEKSAVDMRGQNNARPVIAILPDGVQREFKSGREAATVLGIYKCGISKVLTGKIPHVKQVVFKFKTA